ncbi:cysteine desulfurase family protein [Antrihabitans sp. YC2-6]|uniref:cysteine desulfurase family protein n=1 Tax=Antrihabitans sp. YC2-6 TaxID=2799498 RepID=UPI0018F65839|nr:cysteine desulfurase family protein [Antrihabitans sp. YC2-6]MBJ8348847.1 cysteine desulfurase [Antrihabitans sp. YC2-6]
MTVYLDNNATTRPARAVVAAVVEMMGSGYGNPASSHVVGRAALGEIDQARARVASLIGVRPSRLVWTSGSTEALNTALHAVARTHRHLLVPRTEHKAVLDTSDRLAAVGVPVTWVDVDSSGVVTTEAVEAAIPDRPFALAVMAANNETGVLNDIATLAGVVHERGGVVVCDATQQVGKIGIDLAAWDVDYAAISAHKFYGPPGIGALVVPTGSSPAPLIHGGGHQGGWRSGTLNAPGIVGFGVASALASESLASGSTQIAAMRDQLRRDLEGSLGPCPVNGGTAPRLPNTLNIRIPGVDADALIVNCPSVAFSSGSACTSAVPTPSHVLTAMGLSPVHAEESIRLSVGADTTWDDVRSAAKDLVAAAVRVRDLTDWSV